MHVPTLLATSVLAALSLAHPTKRALAGDEYSFTDAGTSYTLTLVNNPDTDNNIRYDQGQLIDALNQLDGILTDPNCDGSQAQLSSSYDLGGGNTLTVSATAEGDESLCAYQASQWNTFLGAVSTFCNQEGLPSHCDLTLKQGSDIILLLDADAT